MQGTCCGHKDVELLLLKPPPSSTSMHKEGMGLHLSSKIELGMCCRGLVLTGLSCCRAQVHCCCWHRAQQGWLLQVCGSKSDATHKCAKL